MAMRRSTHPYRREDVEEFDRKIRRFHESLAHRERRMLRDIIIAALEEEDMDVAGFLDVDDETILRALTGYLLSHASAPGEE